MTEQPDKDLWLKRVLGLEPDSTPDAGALVKALMGLIRRIPEFVGTDTTLKAKLAMLAGDANTGIKAGDLPKAADLIAQLRVTMDGSRPSQEQFEEHAGKVLAAKAMPVWQAAKDAVDDQLRALSDELRKTGIPELAELCHDVESLLDRIRVGLVVALLDCDNDPASSDKRAAALSAVAAASEWLGTDKRVKAVDENSLGVLVSAGATLGVALRQLQRELDRKAGADS